MDCRRYLYFQDNKVCYIIVNSLIGLMTLTNVTVCVSVHVLILYGSGFLTIGFDGIYLTENFFPNGIRGLIIMKV